MLFLYKNNVTVIKGMSKFFIIVYTFISKNDANALYIQVAQNNVLMFIFAIKLKS